MKEFVKTAFTDVDETFINWPACIFAYVILPKIIDEYNLNDKEWHTNSQIQNNFDFIYLKLILSR